MDTKYLTFVHQEKYQNMKTEEIKENKSILTDLRSIRDKISEELKGMTTEQIVEYLKKKKTLHQTSVWPQGVYCSYSQIDIRSPKEIVYYEDDK